MSQGKRKKRETKTEYGKLAERISDSPKPGWISLGEGARKRPIMGEQEER